MRQNTFKYPSSAHASLIRNRGNMLPPTDDMIRMMIVAMPESWARVRAAVARTRPKLAAAAAVKAVITMKPGTW